MRRPQALSAELRTGLIVKGYVAGETADVPRNMRNLRRRLPPNGTSTFSRVLFLTG
jgi:hypothetical protein